MSPPPTRRLIAMSALPRLAFGLTGVLAPERLCALCGMPPDQVTEETRFVMRAYAMRDLIFAVQQLSAARAGEDEALDALGDAAVTGIGDAVSVLAEIARRGGVRGAMRAGVGFAVTDGIGFPVAWVRARRAR